MTTNSVSKEQIEAMIAGLEGVTPGPWENIVGSGIIRSEGHDGRHDVARSDLMWGLNRSGANAAHIARCDPTTMRLILTELLSLRTSSVGVTSGEVVTHLKALMLPPSKGDSSQQRRDFNDGVRAAIDALSSLHAQPEGDSELKREFAKFDAAYADFKGTGSREAVAWGLLSKDGKVVDANTLRSQFDYLGTSGQVVPLVTLSQLQAVKRERDEAWGARNENAKLKGQRDAALARIKQMQGSNSSMAEGWSALTTRAETAEASLAAAREALKPFAEFAPYVEMFVAGRAAQGGSPMLPTKHFRKSDYDRARAALAGSNGE